MGFRSTPRKTAREAGLKTYMATKPCRHGHMAERLVCNGTCTECVFPSSANTAKYNRDYRAKHMGRDQEIKYRFRYGVELSEIRPKPECCEVCDKPHRKIVFDHCHETGAFRGWICDPCNVALGLVKDNPETLERLAKYLRHPNCGSFVNLLRVQNNAVRKR
jgi:hypothetical protein